MSEENENTENQEEVKPLADFSATEEPDDFETKASEIKVYFLNKLLFYFLMFLFGIVCMAAVTKTGILGVIFFIAALFYLLPVGLIKTIGYLRRLSHYKDYCNKSRDDLNVDVMKFFKKNKK